jgi:hypothetical protein
MIVSLLHEMAHAATVDNHNTRWRTAMQRLRQAGAPIPDEELRAPTRMTKQFIESEATAVLRSDARVNWTLRQFVRGLVLQGEVAQSQAALLRQYPWVSRVFRDTKKRVCKERQAREALRQRLQTGRRGESKAVTVKQHTHGKKEVWHGRETNSAMRRGISPGLP